MIGGADRVVVTGGAGFIGCNLAHRLATQRRPVLVVDNLSRPGVEANLTWLAETHGPLVSAMMADIRDPEAALAAVRGARAVFHLAAQVAVTSSLADPRHDFQVNAAGTLNLLEAARAQDRPPPFVFTSTNKVYGPLPGLRFTTSGGRYVPTDALAAARGVGEDRPLAFASPYGCSKGAADQYVIDYARSFGLPACVLRMSCVYGPRQFGTEDQGWVAHFARRALAGAPVTLYGDGRQVRDVLFVDDLVDALLLAEARMRDLAGDAFNIGGGPDNAISLLEALDRLGRLAGRRPSVAFEDWRPGDQPWYVADASRFAARTGWRARTGAEEGLERLVAWLRGADAPSDRRLAS